MLRLLDPLGDRLLTADRVQRIRLAQAGLGLVLMVASAGVMLYLCAVGIARFGPVALWAAASLAGLAAAFWAIRSGWSLRLADPALTLAQVLYATASAAVAYVLAGAGRGAVLPMLMVILAFGMFRLDGKRIAIAAAFAFAGFGAAMLAMSRADPGTFPPAVEVAHFLMLLVMLPGVSVLAGRLAAMRRRLTRQQLELAVAFERQRESAIRDEVTGLYNRRHALELLEQERQRGVRSGQSFCVARLEIDGFETLAETLGPHAAIELLRSVAREAQGTIRVGDVLARWGDGEIGQFMLIMTNTRATGARLTLERLRARFCALKLNFGGRTVQVSVSAGLTEHIAGQTTPEALERADSALDEAHSQGPSRVVLA